MHHDEVDIFEEFISNTLFDDINIDSKKGSMFAKKVLDYIIKNTTLEINVEFKISPFFNESFNVDNYLEYFLDFSQSRLFYSSFNSDFIYAVKRKYPKLETGLLFESSFNSMKINWNLVDNLHPHWTVINKNLVEKTHKKGKKIVTYPVDSIRIFNKLKEMGVDAVITNDPASLI